MLAELNTHLLKVGGDNRFVAMIYGVYDEATMVLHLANAGLPRPLLLRDEQVEEIDLAGLPLGLFPDSAHEEQAIEVRPGDIAVFCSDGVTECENNSGESFDTAMLPSLLRKLAVQPAQEMAQEINAQALRFAGGHANQLDDYTVLVLKFT